MLSTLPKCSQARRSVDIPYPSMANSVTGMQFYLPTWWGRLSVTRLRSCLEASTSSTPASAASARTVCSSSGGGISSRRLGRAPWPLKFPAN